MQPHLHLCKCMSYESSLDHIIFKMSTSKFMFPLPETLDFSPFIPTYSSSYFYVWFVLWFYPVEFKLCERRNFFSLSTDAFQMHIMPTMPTHTVLSINICWMNGFNNFHMDKDKDIGWWICWFIWRKFPNQYVCVSVIFFFLFLDLTFSAWKALG